MTNENQPRVRKGVPGGGEWKATPKPESADSLTVPKPLSIPVQFDAEVSTGTFINELPEWPEALPAPEVNFGYEDSMVTTFFTVGDKFWQISTSGDERVSTMFNALAGAREQFKEWDEEDLDAVSEWADAVHDRIDSNLYGAAIELAHQPEFNRAVIAAALDKAYEPSVAPVYTAEELEGSSVKQATARAEKGLSAWFAEKTGESLDTDAFTMQDALSDLMHWADAQGIDFSELLDNAQRRYQEEVREEGKDA